MIAKQKLNPEIWEFWSRTHKAWADGALSPLDSSFQEAAKNTLMIEHFVDDSPSVVAAIRSLAPRPDEFLMGYSSDDCDTLLTNRRLMVRDHRSGRHDIYELSEIAACTDQGWWTKTMTVTLHSGTVRQYAKLGGVIKDAFLRYAISQCTKAAPPAPEALAAVPPPLATAENPAPQVQIENEEHNTIQEGDGTMSESEGDMIGAEHPALQQLIKNRLNAGETLQAFATAVTTPTGNLHWVPFVGGMLELGRAATIKPYLLAVTDKRFLIIQMNRYSRITKEIKEVAFDEVPITRIRSAAAQSRFLDSIIYDDSLKIEVGDGSKYHFRKISKENAAMLRDAILGAQDK